MSEWELVEISSAEPDELIDEHQSYNTDGLETEVSDLHSHFWRDAGHLSEVEDRHKQVLISSGMIPESHIASVEPSRKLDWFVTELNGRMNPDGLSIPVKGLEINDIAIHQMSSDNETIIKFNFTEKDGQELERIVNIPNEISNTEFKANFFNNRLYLRW